MTALRIKRYTGVEHKDEVNWLLSRVRLNNSEKTIKFIQQWLQDNRRNYSRYWELLNILRHEHTNYTERYIIYRKVNNEVNDSIAKEYQRHVNDALGQLVIRVAMTLQSRLRQRFEAKLANTQEKLTKVEQKYLKYKTTINDNLLEALTNPELNFTNAQIVALEQTLAIAA